MRALESAGRPGATWKDQLGTLRGGTERDRQTEQSDSSMWWYHRSSLPTGLLPKNNNGNLGKGSKRYDHNQNSLKRNDS